MQSKIPSTVNITIHRREDFDALYGAGFCERTFGVLASGRALVALGSSLPRAEKRRDELWLAYGYETPAHGLQLQAWDGLLASHQLDSVWPAPAFQPNYTALQGSPPAGWPWPGTGVAVLGSARPWWLDALATHVVLDEGAGAARRQPFCLVLEAAQTPDYVSGRLAECFAARSLPLYHGAPNIADFLPHPHSLLLLTDYPSPAALAAHLGALRTNRSAYEEYFAWTAPAYRPLPYRGQGAARSAAALPCTLCAYVRRQLEARP